MNRLLVLLLTLFTACSTAPEAVGEKRPGAVERDRRLAQEDERRRDFNAVLVRLDQGMDSYVKALANRGENRADKQAERLEKLLREEVLDTGSTSYAIGEDGLQVSNESAGNNFARLVALAKDSSLPGQQAIALAALGFSARPDVMPTILQGAMLSDPFRVDRAVLGLAILRAPETPPGVLGKIVEDLEHPEPGRVQAAWALYRLQETSLKQADIIALWRRYLTELQDRLPAGVLVTALRGIGLHGDTADGELVASYLRHAIPRMRMAAALALGRMNAQEQWQELLALLEPTETVQNVRLHARKALAALAGNRDYGYDVAAWRKVFDRGQ